MEPGPGLSRYKCSSSLRRRACESGRSWAKTGKRLARYKSTLICRLVRSMAVSHDRSLLITGFMKRNRVTIVCFIDLERGEQVHNNNLPKINPDLHGQCTTKTGESAD